MFTVIGFYRDNEQVFAEAYEAETWQEAAEMVPAGVSIVAVLAGDVTPVDDFSNVE